MVYLEPGWTGINDMAYSTVYAAISVFYFFLNSKKSFFTFSVFRWLKYGLRVEYEYELNTFN